MLQNVCKHLKSFSSLNGKIIAPNEMQLSCNYKCTAEQIMVMLQTLSAAATTEATLSLLKFRNPEMIYKEHNTSPL